MRRSLSTLLLLLPATTVQAQLEPDDQFMDMSVEELLRVTVSSASLFPESMLQAAATVRKISATQWSLWGARENSQVYSNMGSVEAYPTLFGGHALAIRGYTQFLSVRGVATLLDGVPLNDPIFGSAQYDNEHVGLGVLDSIEVVVGPGSTLYGSDAFHGTVALQSYHADEDELKAHLQVGAPQYQAVSAQSSHVFSDQAILNLAVDLRDQNPEQILDREQSWGKGSFLMKLHSAPKTDLRYEVSAYTNRYNSTDSPGGGGKFGHQLNDQSQGDHILSLGRGEIEYATEAGKFGLKASHWDLTRNDSFEIASGIFEQKQVIDRGAGQAYWQFENEALRLYTGAEYTEENVRRSTQNQIDQVNQTSSAQRQVEQGFSRAIRSLFTQGRLKQTGIRGMEMEFGIRSDDYSDFGRQSSPRLSAIYSLSPTRVIKAIYSNAFRAAVTLEQYGSTTIKGSSLIRPEQLDSYELIFIDGYSNWSYQLTGFSTLWKNGIIAVPLAGDPIYTSEFRNSGKNTSQGLEGEVRVKGKTLLLTTQLSSVTSTNSLTHQPYSAFPKLSGSVQLEGKIDDRQSAHTRVVFKSEWKDGTEAAATYLGPYQRWDMGWVYHGMHDRTLTVSVINILDRDNRLPSILDNPGGEPDEPRHFDLSLAWLW